MAELSARDSKLVQYLNEAYGKEKELETSLQAHIGVTSRGSYKKRLQQHLAETKRHARELERRIKKVGGTPEAGPLEGFEPLAKGASVAVGIGNRAVAAVQAPIHVLRGTGEQERMLKNAKTEYANEHEEIATYTAIEALAEILSDSETARIARSIRREEERMAKFLERLIPTLTKAVTQAEIPPAQRRATSSRGRAKASRRNGAAKRGSSTASRRSSSTRSTSSRSASSRGRAKVQSKAASKATRSASKATAKASRARSKATVKASHATTKARRAGSTASTRARRRVASGGRRLGVSIGA